MFPERKIALNTSEFYQKTARCLNLHVPIRQSCVPGNHVQCDNHVDQAAWTTHFLRLHKTFYIPLDVCQAFLVLSVDFASSGRSFSKRSTILSKVFLASTISSIEMGLPSQSYLSIIRRKEAMIHKEIRREGSHTGTRLQPLSRGHNKTYHALNFVHTSECDAWEASEKSQFQCMRIYSRRLMASLISVRS